MKCVVVPNALRDAIYEKIDAALAAVPDALPDREHFYQTVLNYYDVHGELPEIELRRSNAAPREEDK